MNAPFFYERGKAKNKSNLKWIKYFDFKYSKSKKANGYVGIFDEGRVGFSKTKLAGFSLFRRNRLIKGVGENEGYRPAEIFGNPQSHSYQRIFGEIHLEDEEVTHTKDAFQWSEEEEEEFIKKLKHFLEKEPINIYDQAKNYRLDRRARDLKVQTVEGLDQAIKLAPTALKILEEIKIPRQIERPKEIPKSKDKEVRRKTMKYIAQEYTGVINLCEIRF